MKNFQPFWPGLPFTVEGWVEFRMILLPFLACLYTGFHENPGQGLT